MLLPIEEEDLKTPGIVPVFPLPNCVLLPCEPFPLHIFEERYKQMTESALTGKRLIAMAHLKPGWEMQAEKPSEIYPVAGLGKIVMDDRFSDGRFNILLIGLKRIKIKGFVQNRPYRTAEVEVMNDRFSQTSSSLIVSLATELLAVTNKFLSHLGKDIIGDKESPAAFLKNLSVEMFPLGMLTDIVASMLPMTPLEKQMILEETDVIARCEKLIFVLKTHLQSLSGGSGRYSSSLH